MERIEFKFNRVLAMYQRLGERLEELAKEIDDRKEVAAMAEKAGESLGREAPHAAATTAAAAAAPESWDDDDHPPFSLCPDSRRKRNPANYCPVTRGRLHKVAAMAEEDRMERRRMQQQQQQQQQQRQMSESWDDDDHPPFGLGPDSRRKRNPANYCPVTRGRLH